MAVGYQSFYQAQLTAGISDTDLSIPVDVVPTVDEGFLVIESTVANKREIIYFTSKTASTVECPSGAGNGRGYDGTTAVSHLQGSAVIMAPVGAMFSELREQFTTTPQGWTSLVQNISTVTANGNRSYTLGFDASVSSILSEGMRLRTTRTSAATTNAFSLDGSNDYYNDTTVSGMTFTDDFSVSAWVYLTSYGTISPIASRYNGTSGWSFQINASGVAQLFGFNAGAGNNSGVETYQSIPLNKWVHIAAQLDMSAYSVAGTTNSYMMLDGVAVPALVNRAGTNPTALVQAGNLEIGARASGAQVFPGYIDQVAIYSAKVTQATHLAAMHQGLTGSETSLISAYANGSTTDLNTTNANNLTAQNGATTVASAPWGNRGASSTLDYALVMSVSGANVTVQVPEGCTIPTTGGVSAVAYSTQASPYGFVSDRGRWEINLVLLSQVSTSGTTLGTIYNPGGLNLSYPVGTWEYGYQFSITITPNASYPNTYAQISSSSSAFDANRLDMAKRTLPAYTANSQVNQLFLEAKGTTSFSSVTPLYALIMNNNAFTGMTLRGVVTIATPELTKIYGIPSNL